MVEELVEESEVRGTVMDGWPRRAPRGDVADDVVEGDEADKDEYGGDGDATPASCRSLESTKAMLRPCVVCSTGRRGVVDSGKRVGVGWVVRLWGEMGGVGAAWMGCVSMMTTGSSSSAFSGGGARMTACGAQGRW